jgi:hemoglobin-like flavoprotein
MNSQPLQPLTAKQVNALKQTFKNIIPERLAMRFYSTLFVEHPEVKSVFPSDLSDLSTKLVGVFHLVIYSFKEARPDQYVLQQDLLRPLRNLGDLHAKKGVKDEYYPWANKILIRSIREETPVDFTVETEIAWTLALDHLTAAMLTDDMAGKTAQHNSMRDSFELIKSILFKK